MCVYRVSELKRTASVEACTMPQSRKGGYNHPLALRQSQASMHDSVSDSRNTNSDTDNTGFPTVVGVSRGNLELSANASTQQLYREVV